MMQLIYATVLPVRHKITYVYVPQLIKHFPRNGPIFFTPYGSFTLHVRTNSIDQYTNKNKFENSKGKSVKSLTPQVRFDLVIPV